ncbi:MAG: hypothetical protein ACKVX7_16140 [Planctomycetota bacterium]
MLQRGNTGFTIVEVLIGSVLVITGFVGLAGLQISNERSHANAVVNAHVNSGFRLLAERIRGAPFGDTAGLYQGAVFSVPGLTGATGTATIFLDETLDTAESNMLGLPRDLDGDGAATNPDVSANYMLLPIKLELAWTDPLAGLQTRVMYYLLAQEE